jgi:hypothetical protein
MAYCSQLKARTRLSSKYKFAAITEQPTYWALGGLPHHYTLTETACALLQSIIDQEKLHLLMDSKRIFNLVTVMKCILQVKK